MAKRTRACVRGEPASNAKKRTRENNSKSAHNAVQQRTAPKIATQIPRTANALKARRIVFTPEALAHARYRYEHTDASLADIAVDLQVAKGTVRNLAKSEGWTRYAPPARNLPPEVHLMVQASNVEAQTSGIAVPGSPGFR